MKRSYYTIIALSLVLMLVVYSKYSPLGVAGTPQHGSYMARFYSPYYFDYVMIDDAFVDKQVDSSVENVTVQGHLYIEGAESTGLENEFKVFEFYYRLDPTYLNYLYGATVKVSDPSLTDEYKLYVTTPYRNRIPDEYYIQTLSTDTWYNITMVHSDTDLELFINDAEVWSQSTVPDFEMDMNHLRIGEIETELRGEEFAYNIYVDYIRIEGGGLASALEWDFEVDFSDFDYQYVTTGSTLEIVMITEAGYLVPAPDVDFSITPNTQDGYAHQTLEYELECFNNGTEAQFTLEIVSREDDGDVWVWSFSEVGFTLGADETKFVDLYCIVGAEGNYSNIVVDFRRVGTSIYSSDTAQAVSIGDDPATYSPIGVIPSIAPYTYNLFGLFGSLGLGGLFYGAMSRGQNYIVGIIGFAFGIVFFTMIQFLPEWVMITMFALLILSFAVKVMSSIGGDDQ